MKTKKLKYTPDFDFNLLGISSAETDYKLSWLIASLLEVEFLRGPDLKIYDPKIPEEQIFSVFENITKTEEYNLKIVSNKGTIGYLIYELKNIDYFLIVSGNNEKKFINNLLKKLRSVENISAVFNLDPSTLKSKEKLLF